MLFLAAGGTRYHEPDGRYPVQTNRARGHPADFQPVLVPVAQLVIADDWGDLGEPSSVVSYVGTNIRRQFINITEVTTHGTLDDPRSAVAKRIFAREKYLCPTFVGL